jgi:hypothetical protein
MQGEQQEISAAQVNNDSLQHTVLDILLLN